MWMMEHIWLAEWEEVFGSEPSRFVYCLRYDVEVYILIGCPLC